MIEHKKPNRDQTSLHQKIEKPTMTDSCVFCFRIMMTYVCRVRELVTANPVETGFFALNPVFFSHLSIRKTAASFVVFTTAS